MTNTKITNFIQFNGNNIATATGTGRFSSLTHDIELKAVPFTSDNPDAPTHRVFGKSPAGYELEVGGIWQGKNQQGGVKYTLHVKPLRLNANLGRFPGQDDETLQAIIPWEDRN